MQRYIARRLMLMIPTLLLVSVIVFGLMHIIPGDTVIARLAEIGVVTEDSIQTMRHDLGIDKPLIVQYGSWLGGLVRGDMGISLWAHRPVLTRLWQAIPVSAELALLGVSLAIIVAVPLGVVSAIRQDTKVDYVARLFAITGISMPEFWIGTMLILYLSLYFGFIPPVGYVAIWKDPLRNLQQFMLPAIVLGFRLSASTARMVRATMLDVLRQDYIRTARAKGLREAVVVYQHALRNALLPIVTILGTQLAGLLGGTVILETLFSLPGVGLLTLSSIEYRDYTQLQGNVVFFAAVLLTMNLLVDLCYAIIDPRIRYQ